MRNLELFYAISTTDIGQMYIQYLQDKLDKLYRTLVRMDGIDLTRTQGQCILLEEELRNLTEARANLEEEKNRGSFAFYGPKVM